MQFNSAQMDVPPSLLWFPQKSQMFNRIVWRCVTEFYPNRALNVKSKNISIFMSLIKVICWVLRLHENHNYSTHFCKTYKRTLNFPKIAWKKIENTYIFSFTLLRTVCGVPRNFVREGSTNSVAVRGQRKRGSGGGSPLIRGSVGSCNLVK